MDRIGYTDLEEPTLECLIWTFIHGAYSGFQPYPFLNGSELGTARVLLNEAGLLAIFLILGLVLVTGGRLIGRVRKAKTE